MVMVKRGSRLIHAFLILLFIAFFVIPMIPLVLSSISMEWRWPEWIPHSFSFRAWRYVLLEHTGTWTAIGNSLWIALSATGINLLLGIPAAHALGRLPLRGRWLIEGMLYAPLVIPPFVSIMGLQMTFIRLGLTETFTGVILAHIVPSLPYVIRALIISFRTLGIQWEEQAKMLGAGWVSRFRYVVFPHILPGIVTGASLSILVSLSQYLITFLVGGGQVITLPLLLYPFMNGGDPAIGSVYSLLFAGTAAFLLWSMEGMLNHYYRMNIRIHL
jgi:putative spermidine/putrescine transport system permease protein